MKHEFHVRTPQGDPLDADSKAALQTLIAEHGVRGLVVPLGVSITALTRAAAGMRVLAGTRVLIRQGLARLPLGLCSERIEKETAMPGPHETVTVTPEQVGSLDALFRPIGMDFGDAIRALKAGSRVARRGWNGKGMWLALSPGKKDLPAGGFWAQANRDYAADTAEGCADVLPCITMKTATGEILMGWLASQTDMLAEDWEVV